jgi:hypothetical protein
MPFKPDPQPTTRRSTAAAPVTVDNGTGRFVPDRVETTQPTAEFPNPQGISDLARRGFGRGGRAPDEATRRAMMNNGFTRTVEGLIDDPMGTLEAGAAGFNRGVANLAGLPVDTIANVGDLLGMAYGATRAAFSDRPANEFYEPFDRSQHFGTGENLANLLDRGSEAVGGGPVTQNPRPENPAARLAFGVGQSVPGALTLRQVAANTAGGAGSAVVAEAGGDPATQAMAGMLGGRAAERRTPPAGSPWSRDVLEQQARGQQPANAQQGPFLPDSGGAAAAMPPQLAKVPTEMRGPLMVALMRGDRDLATSVIDAETLPVPVRMLEGQARGDAKLISEELNLRGTDERLPQVLQEQNQALIENLDTIRREVAPNVVGNDHVQNGQALIDSYKAYDEPVRAEITAAYKALEDANGGNIAINSKAFVDAADAALGKKLKARYLPAAIRGDLDQIKEQGGLMTLEQFENLRTNLATAARDADRGALGGGGNAAAAIRLVRDELENMPVEGAAADVKALADRARALSKARFDRMRADPAYEAAVDDPTPAGELSPFADEFVRKHVVNGKAANLQRMRENLSADPIAAETIAAAALNYVKGKSGVNLYTNEGNFSQAGYNRALAELTPRLKALVPDQVAEVLEQLGRVARRVQVRPKGAYVNESNTFVAATAKNLGENVLNKLSLGTKAGTELRRRTGEKRDRARVDRALDPANYLSTAPEE